MAGAEFHIRHFIFGFALVAFLSAVKILFSQPPDSSSSGLIAWYPFEAGATDASGNSRNGKFLGDARLVPEGRVGKALYLDGEGDYISLGHELNLADYFAVIAWLRTEDIDRKYPNILSKYETNTEGPFDFAMDYDKIKLGLSEAGIYRAYYSESTIPQDRWVHVAWVGNGQNFRIYINGEIDARHRIAPMTQNQDEVCIGRQAFMFESNGDLEFKGFIDELRIYNRALSDDEIRDLYLADLPGSRVWAIAGRLIDDQTGNGIRGSIIFEDAKTGKEIIRAKSSESDGTFRASITGQYEVNLVAEAEGFVPGSSFYEYGKSGTVEAVIRMKPMKVGTEILLESVYFIGGTATLMQSSSPALDRLANLLKENPGIHIEISGHTDGASTDENWKIRLSGARADAVKNYLTAQYIEANRITTRAWGDEKPVASNSTKDSRRLNRRVEFRITKL